MSETNESMIPPPMSAGLASQEDRTLAMLTHLSGIILCFIIPLVVWLTQKDKPDRAWLNEQAKEALNFQITMFIVYLVCKVLMLLLIGFILLPIAWIFNLVFCIIAGLKVFEGVSYRFPVALRLIK